MRGQLLLLMTLLGSASLLTINEASLEEIYAEDQDQLDIGVEEAEQDELMLAELHGPIGPDGPKGDPDTSEPTTLELRAKSGMDAEDLSGSNCPTFLFKWILKAAAAYFIDMKGTWITFDNKVRITGFQL